MAGDIDVVLRNGEGRTLAVVRKKLTAGEIVDAEVLIKDGASQ